ncbi:MAG: hypothetical protein MUD14_02560 [Hydrococcus sp. Prado102]|jgi:hypothetical protein|nr:hypothetical protein [Hydrococcus sp. Prado102]
MRKLLTLVPSLSIASQNLVDSDPKQRLKVSLKQLQSQAERINLLSAELERSIWEFETLATQINEDSRFFRIEQRQAKRFQICEYHSVFLPIIQQKSNGRFVVTSRNMNLSQPKQKARSLIQRLRQWIIRKPTGQEIDKKDL